MSVIYGQDEMVSQWVSLQLAGIPNMFSSMCRALGIMEKGRLVGGVVYDGYRETAKKQPLLIEASLATIDKSWANRHNLRTIFYYPFVQLGLERVQLTTSASNERVNSLVSRLGFKKEGKHPKAYIDGSDAFSWGMLKHDCLWLRDGRHGKE